MSVDLFCFDPSVRPLLTVPEPRSRGSRVTRTGATISACRARRRVTARATPAVRCSPLPFRWFVRSSSLSPPSPTTRNRPKRTCTRCVRNWYYGAHLLQFWDGTDSQEKYVFTSLYKLYSLRSALACTHAKFGEFTTVPRRFFSIRSESAVTASVL